MTDRLLSVAHGTRGVEKLGAFNWPGHDNRSESMTPARCSRFRVPDSMTSAGIYSGDLLAMERTLVSHPGKIVVSVVKSVLCVKCPVQDATELSLCSENPAWSRFPPALCRVASPRYLYLISTNSGVTNRC